MKSSKKKPMKSPAAKDARPAGARPAKAAKERMDARPARSAQAAPALPAEDAAEEIDRELLEFVRAIDEYKRLNRRQFPTWGEVLRVVRTLGYKRSA